MKNDDQTFFEQYLQMPRSRQGLAAAEEWHQLKKLFPPLSGKSVAATAGTAGTPMYWLIDGYFTSGERVTSFLGCRVVKQHHTLTQILNGLLECGFTLTAVEEARPPEDMLDQPGMADELRRPMMLLVRVEKGG